MTFIIDPIINNSCNWKSEKITAVIDVCGERLHNGYSV
jgi:hypothetical protein